MADTVNTPAPAPTPTTTAPPNEYKVAEIRDDGTVILSMDDGRMFPATIKEGVKDVHKRSHVSITNLGEDADGAPVDATITKVIK